jgi:hypothetical protein
MTSWQTMATSAALVGPRGVVGCRFAFSGLTQLAGYATPPEPGQPTFIEHQQTYTTLRPSALRTLNAT